MYINGNGCLSEMEKVDVKKFLQSFANPVAWWKTARFAIGLAALIFVGFTVYKAYFVPTQRNTQKIIVGRGWVGNIFQGESGKSTKSNHGMEPFVELYGQFDSDSERRAGIKCGIKFF
jgi:hypothetical protein